MEHYLLLFDEDSFWGSFSLLFVVDIVAEIVPYLWFSAVVKNNLYALIFTRPHTNEKRRLARQRPFKITIGIAIAQIVKYSTTVKPL